MTDGSGEPTVNDPSAMATPPAASSGISERTASGLAYITIIPAIIFLVLDPYNKSKVIKFHCFQCLGLAVTWIIANFMFALPILGWFFGAVLHVIVFFCWIICMIRAFSGGRFKLPIVGDLAEQQSNN